jgi:hypothetical protein
VRDPHSKTAENGWIPPENRAEAAQNQIDRRDIAEKKATKF